uniref:Uncharacterized protein n=1 Tax=Myoviridae sp. ctMYT7 TaxID=2825087 RepID=A0A8S5Q3R2_9CAUD|nr:MAG TPA: hypothetical protein [Myoviridae sp. ctMYT7]
MEWLIISSTNPNIIIIRKRVTIHLSAVQYYNILIITMKGR